MNRRGLLLAGVIALVAGCGSEPSQTERADAPPSTASPSPDPSQTSEGDRHICETVIAEAGDAYGWLVTLERERSISGDLNTPGYIDVYQLGGMVSAFGGNADSADLETALQLIIIEGQALRRAIDDQTAAVPPTGLRSSLERAADVCIDLQVAIPWRSA